MTEPASGEDGAAALVARERVGVLSTSHAGLDGWPFGTVVPYALTPDGDPLLLLSDVAEHTKNLRADPRASLLVRDPDPKADPQASARVTILARAVVLGGDEAGAAFAEYARRFPDAEGHLAAHGFAVHRLAVERVRWIAGFGRMGWIDRGSWSGLAQGAWDLLAPHAQAIREHVNADHRDALIEIAALSGVSGATAARMSGIDARGFDLVVERGDAGTGTPLRVAFEAPVTTPDAARRAFIAILAKARRARAAR
jgi:heme iron utilization protein